MSIIYNITESKFISIILFKYIKITKKEYKKISNKNYTKQLKTLARQAVK